MVEGMGLASNVLNLRGNLPSRGLRKGYWLDDCQDADLQVSAASANEA